MVFFEAVGAREKERAVAAVCGRVVGGALIFDDGYYLLEISDDGTDRPLFTAIELLEADSAVMRAFPAMRHLIE